ncbi:MAG: hypothetical protein EAZ34_05180 [Polaromonas sp.]|nr:MAG: hypothetical protein EAZ34_05180 [Polaromonas sp.]
MQRRSLLKLGVTAAAALSIVGGAVAWLQPGLERGALSPLGREVFWSVGAAVLDKTLPAQDGAREIALEGLLQRVDVLVGTLPSHAQNELSQLLSLLGNPAGRLSLAGLARPWADASLEEVQKALQAMRVSSLALRQQAYAALHEITAGAYFSAPSSWSLLGYPGPLKF